MCKFDYLGRTRMSFMSLVNPLNSKKRIDTPLNQELSNFPDFLYNVNYILVSSIGHNYNNQQKF